jgi:nitrate reductase gamma subunit
VNLRRLTRATDLLGTIFLLVGVGLGIYYVAAGSYVDESGALIEEFWALGSAWIFVLASVFMAMLGLVLRLVARKT